MDDELKYTSDDDGIFFCCISKILALQFCTTQSRKLKSLFIESNMLYKPTEHDFLQVLA